MFSKNIIQNGPQIKNVNLKRNCALSNIYAILSLHAKKMIVGWGDLWPRQRGKKLRIPNNTFKVPKNVKNENFEKRN